MTNRPTALRDPEFMRAMLDVVIPTSNAGRMPGAGGLGLEAEIAAAIEADTMIGPVLKTALEALRQAAESRDARGMAGLDATARNEVVQAQMGHEVLMMALARYVYAAYYAHPRVLEGLGEPARPPFPEGYEVEPTDPQLLERLKRRRRSV